MLIVLTFAIAIVLVVFCMAFYLIWQLRGRKKALTSRKQMADNSENQSQEETQETFPLDGNFFVESALNAEKFIDAFPDHDSLAQNIVNWQGNFAKMSTAARFENCHTLNIQTFSCTQSMEQFENDLPNTFRLKFDLFDNFSSQLKMMNKLKVLWFWAQKLKLTSYQGTETSLSILWTAGGRKAADCYSIRLSHWNSAISLNFSLSFQNLLATSMSRI